MGNDLYRDDCVLVTGGTGSFGKVVTRHLLDRGVGAVRILSRDEAKQHDMRTSLGDPRVSFWIGDVRDRQAVARAMRGVDRVFHAAALKQVPSCEFFPLEAVQTNVAGSANVIDAAIAEQVATVICLSTDKAVMPINAMGMTKALMEKVVESAARGDTGDTVVSTVRYGNVMYSRGSVLPLFVDRVRAGESLPITDPEMTRFLLVLDDAVDLVEAAFRHARPGDTFIRKAPAAQMGELATALQEFLGRSVGEHVIGVRHGEKLYETLATAAELSVAEDLGDYWRLPMDSRDLNYREYFETGTDDRRGEDFHSHNAVRLERNDVIALFERIPELVSARDELAAGSH